MTSASSLKTLGCVTSGPINLWGSGSCNSSQISSSFSDSVCLHLYKPGFLIPGPAVQQCWWKHRWRVWWESLPFQHCGWLIHLCSLTLGQYFLLLVVYVPEESFLIFFDLSGQFQFELSSCFSNCICTPWQCPCISQWVFHLWYASLLVLSRHRSSHLSPGSLLFRLLCSPLKGMNWFCASRSVSLKNWQHSQVPSSSMEASQGIYPNWTWSECKNILDCMFLP